MSLLQRNTKLGTVLSAWHSQCWVNGTGTWSVGRVNVHTAPPLPGPPSLALHPISAQPVPSLGLVLLRSRTLHLACWMSGSWYQQQPCPPMYWHRLAFDRVWKLDEGVFHLRLLLVGEHIREGRAQDTSLMRSTCKQSSGWVRAINHFPQSLTAQPAFHPSGHSALWTIPSRFWYQHTVEDHVNGLIKDRVDCINLSALIHRDLVNWSLITRLVKSDLGLANLNHLF